VSPLQKLLATILAVLLHLPLFWQAGSGLQHGEQRDANAVQSGITLKLAARPAPAPIATPSQPTIKPAPVAPPDATAKPEPKPNQTFTPPQDIAPTPREVTTRESSNEAEDDSAEPQQQNIGGQTMGLGGSSAIGEDDNALARYKGIIHNRIQRLRQYPQQARMREQQGTVEVTFAVAADGEIAEYRISRSSGSPLLDRATERLFSRLKLPPPDQSILSDLTAITVPVTYQLDER
jgi:periplasmic protein TonB